VNIAVREGRGNARIRYPRSSELPALRMWVSDSVGALIDFSTGYTFSFRIGEYGAAPIVNKSDMIVGATGSGTPTNGAPNVTVTWDYGELNIDPGVYAWDLVATNGISDRILQGTFTITKTVGVPVAEEDADGGSPLVTDDYDGGVPSSTYDTDLDGGNS
jgi:hypothetical protein